MSGRDRSTIVVEPSDYVLRNAGDMAMMQVAMGRLAAMFPDADIAVFSDVPDELSTPAPNVRAVDATGRRLWLHTPLVPDGAVPARLRGRAARAARWLRRRSPRLARAAIRLRLDADGRASVDDHLALLARADLVLATGMGGVTDVFPDYAFDLLETLAGARRAGGARTVMVGQGIGPIDDPVLSAYAARVLGEVDLIALREERAARPLLHRLGVDPRRIVTTGDDAIELASGCAPAGLGRDLGVNLRISDYAAITDDVAARLATTLRDAARALGAGLRTVAISAVPGEEDRRSVQRLLGDVVGEDADAPVGTSIDGAIESIARCRLVVTGSYHAALFALSMGVPAIGLAASRYYEDKFLGLAEQFGPGCDVVLLSGPTAGAELGDLILAAWHRAPDTRPSLRAAARRQVDLGHAAYERIRELVGPPAGPAPSSGCLSAVRT